MNPFKIRKNLFLEVPPKNELFLSISLSPLPTALFGHWGEILPFTLRFLGLAPLSNA
jgi:hypothetical protein